MADKYEVIWEPQKGPQTALLACPCFEVFFGGARGGGKTDGMLGEWISHQDLYGEHAIGLMVRRERTQLLETIERSRQIYTPLGAKFHEQDKYWRFPNGSRLRFAYLERDADAEQYQGHSYTRLYVEEIGTFANSAPIFKLMATLRSAHGVPVGFRATGNPGGPGHQWVRARYIDGAPLGWKITNSEFKNPWTNEIVTRDRVFIPSKLQDNRYLGTDYVANLQMVGNSQLVRAWLEGDWSVIEGAFFPEFSESRHVIPPFSIPGNWLRFRSADWGSARPFSVGWWAVATDDYTLSSRVIPRGAIVRYREWYGQAQGQNANTGLKLTAEEVGLGIVQRETSGQAAEARDLEGKTNITYGVLDPAAFAEDGGPSIAERIFRASGILFRRADNARISQRGAMGGWDQVRARLIGDDGRPMMYFFSTCRDSIRTLPALQHDRDKPEDVDSESEDHAPDEIRYACMSRPYVRQLDKGPATRILGVGPHNQVTLNDLWEHQPKRKTERV
jgi:hypothetical protein